ncbi:hypothetical protein K438DRAFT_1765333 [Mycena galopus ATCC 62051]|nr:hypothetical protein K438DRAFT_1765333 [Mycena galopus ATCC 62051]
MFKYAEAAVYGAQHFADSDVTAVGSRDHNGPRPFINQFTNRVSQSPFSDPKTQELRTAWVAETTKNQPFAQPFTNCVYKHWLINRFANRNYIHDPSMIGEDTAVTIPDDFVTVFFILFDQMSPPVPTSLRNRPDLHICRLDDGAVHHPAAPHRGLHERHGHPIHEAPHFPEHAELSGIELYLNTAHFAGFGIV